MLWVHPWVLLQGSPLLSSVVCQYVPVKRAYLFLDIAAAGWVDYVPSGTRNCFRCNRVLLNFSKPWGSNSPCLPWPPLVRCQLCVGNTSIAAEASVGQEASACQEHPEYIVLLSYCLLLRCLVLSRWWSQCSSWSFEAAIVWGFPWEIGILWDKQWEWPKFYLFFFSPALVNVWVWWDSCFMLDIHLVPDQGAHTTALSMYVVALSPCSGHAHGPAAFGRLAQGNGSGQLKAVGACQEGWDPNACCKYPAVVFCEAKEKLISQHFTISCFEKQLWKGFFCDK